ncbi:MAG: porin [Rhodoferax sp.]
MKKSLIAMAVLAASGASFAQSNVTLYGLADVWFGSVKTERGGASLTQTVMQSGGVNGSRWGLKGSEDLGGGLKANFKLEQGFSLDTGKAKDLAPKIDGSPEAGNAAFARYAYVGLSGGFGEVKFGKTGTAYDDVSGASDAVFDSALAPMNSVFTSVNYNWNPANTIYYQAPNMGGFSGAISYSLGEDKTPTTGASSLTSLNLTYEHGPLALQFGYQVEDIVNTPAKPNDVKFLRLGGSYDFGMATAKLTYGKTTSIGNKDGYDAKEFQVGVDVPVSSALTLSASYAKSDDSNPAGVFEPSRKGYGLAAAYTLSKRTFLYGGYRSNTETQQNAPDNKDSVFAIGIQHKF